MNFSIKHIFIIIFIIILCIPSLKADQEDTNIEDALWEAIQQNRLNDVKRLIPKLSNVNAKIRFEQPPIAFANTPEMLDYLISKGADINLNGLDLVYSYISGLNHEDDCNMNWIKHLIKKGAKFKIEDGKTINVLHYSAQRGYKKLILFFLKQGMDINARTDSGKTPLHYAAESREPWRNSICKFLLDNGAKVNIKDNNGQTELHKVMGSDLNIIKILEAKGADIKIPDNHGYTILHHVANNLDVAKYLILRKANVNAKSVNEITPLHHAAEGGYVKIIDILISNGATIDIKASYPGGLMGIEPSGITPLTVTIICNKAEAAEYLLKKGANPNIMDFNKHTPMYYAIQKENQEMQDLLKKYGGR